MPGEPVVSVGTTTLLRQLVLEQDMGGLLYSIPRGTYPMIGHDEKRLYFAPGQTFMTATLRALSDIAQGFCYGALYQQQHHPDYAERTCQGGSDAPQALYVNAAPLPPQELCVVNYDGESYCYDGAPEVRDLPLITSTDRETSLLFSGRSGGELHFMYIEKRGGQAIMQHEVSYEAVPGQEIAYRDARLNIVAFTDSGIICEVLSIF